MKHKIHVIGAGLAGCEAAHQIARRGIAVELYEMKPERYTPAHRYPGFAELVCSNSLRADRLENAVGLLKEEMRLADSLIIEAADRTRVPAGGALAVDRTAFSDYITSKIKKNPRITLHEGEVASLEGLEGIIIVASGPLTSEALSQEIADKIGGERLHFFDAAAPIVMGESLDYEKVFAASRYGKGTDDYLNCPMTKEEYQAFYQALISAECAQLHGFEGQEVFEGCMPVEVMAKRGEQTLLFGPLKPVGLTAPDGTRPYAVVQLRKEDEAGRMYNLVGFQTHLKFGEQKRVFSMIPGLEQAEFARFGVMHQNTYLNSPKILDAFYRLRADGNLFFAGQMTGVEGYVESAASGLYAGLAAAFQAEGRQMPALSGKTAMGALARYISSSPSADFQPMNITFGIIDPPEQRFRKKAEKNTYLSQRALEEVRGWAEGLAK